MHAAYDASTFTRVFVPVPLILAGQVCQPKRWCRQSVRLDTAMTVDGLVSKAHGSDLLFVSSQLAVCSWSEQILAV